MEEMWEGKRETGKREMLRKHIFGYWGVMAALCPPPSNCYVEALIVSTTGMLL